MYGNPEVTAGGNALKFYSSVRIDIRRKEILKENDGIMVKIKVVKNKVKYSIIRDFDFMNLNFYLAMLCVVALMDYYIIQSNN